jgi:hypothetical protein
MNNNKLDSVSGLHFCRQLSSTISLRLELDLQVKFSGDIPARIATR